MPHCVKYSHTLKIKSKSVYKKATLPHKFNWKNSKYEIDTVFLPAVTEPPGEFTYMTMSCSKHQKLQ